MGKVLNFFILEPAAIVSCLLLLNFSFEAVLKGFLASNTMYTTSKWKDQIKLSSTDKI